MPMPHRWCLLFISPVIFVGDNLGLTFPPPSAKPFIFNARLSLVFVIVSDSLSRKFTRFQARRRGLFPSRGPLFCIEIYTRGGLSSTQAFFCDSVYVSARLFYQFVERLYVYIIYVISCLRSQDAAPIPGRATLLS